MNLDNLLKELKKVSDEAPEAFKRQQQIALSQVEGDARMLMIDTISKINKLTRDGNKEGLEALAEQLKKKAK